MREYNSPHTDRGRTFFLLSSHATFLLLLSWAVIAVESSSRSTVITTQSFKQNYSCTTEDENCSFVCTKAYGACLWNTFTCYGNSTCTIDCIQTLSCSYITIECPQNATIHLNCHTNSTCIFYRNNCPSAIMSPIKVQTLSSGFGAALIALFAIQGHTIENSYPSPRGSMQLLGLDFPYDNQTRLHQLTANLYKDIAYVISESRQPNWRSYPNFFFRLIHPLVFEVWTDDVPGIILKTTQDLLLPYSRVMYVTAANYSFENTKLSMAVTFLRNLTNDYIIPFLHSEFTYYSLGIFKYPNDSFIQLTISVTAQLHYNIEIIHTPWNCRSPSPFYDTYCYYDKWYSDGDKNIGFVDLIASPSIHHGSFNVTETELRIEGGSFETSESVTIDSSHLTVFDSNLTVNTLRIEHSQINIGATSVISVNTLNIGSNSTLMLHLTSSDMEYLQSSSDGLSFTINSSTIEGHFSSVLYDGLDASTLQCLHSSSSTQNGRLTILLQISCGDSGLSKEAVIGISVSVVGVLLIGVLLGVLLFLKKKQIIATLMGLSGAKNEPTPPAEPDKPKEL